MTLEPIIWNFYSFWMWCHSNAPIIFLILCGLLFIYMALTLPPSILKGVGRGSRRKNRS